MKRSLPPTTGRANSAARKRAKRAQQPQEERERARQQNTEAHWEKRRSESPAQMLQRLSLARQRSNSNLSEMELSESGTVHAI